MQLKRIRQHLLVALFALAACGGGGGGNGTPRLYVSDVGTDLVSIYLDASAADGDIAPDSAIGGVVTTMLDNPYGMHYDRRTDTLVVGDLDNSAIKFFDGVGALDGDVAPTRTLSGATAMIENQNGFEVFVDTRRNLLYFANDGGIYVYANANSIDGDVAPVRRITGASTGFSASRDKRIVVDTAADRLFVTDDRSVLVFDNASTLDGDVAPDRVVTGGNTGFDFLWGIALDTQRNVLYLADESSDVIHIYANASTIDGDVAPNRVLSGVATMLQSPADMDVDIATNRLYACNVNPSGVLVWDNASTVDGDVAPTRMITGAATGFTSPKDLAVSR